MTTNRAADLILPGGTQIFGLSRGITLTCTMPEGGAVNFNGPGVVVAEPDQPPSFSTVGDGAVWKLIAKHIKPAKKRAKSTKGDA